MRGEVSGLCLVLWIIRWPERVRSPGVAAAVGWRFQARARHTQNARPTRPTRFAKTKNPLGDNLPGYPPGRQAGLRKRQIATQAPAKESGRIRGERNRLACEWLHAFLGTVANRAARGSRLLVGFAARPALSCSAG